MLLVGSIFSGYAQTTVQSVEEAITIALQQNAGLQAISLQEEQQLQLQKTASQLNKALIFHSYDENNIAPNGRALRVLGIQQEFPFPTVWSSRKRLYQLNTSLAQTQYDVELWNLKRQVAQAYYEILYHQNRLQQLQYLDSLYASFQEAADRRYEVGESGYLEKITATNYYQRIHLQRLQEEEALRVAQDKLQGHLQTEYPVKIAFTSLTQVVEPDSITAPPGAVYYELSQQRAQASLRLQRQMLWPDISLEYFRGFGYGEEAQDFDGYAIGLSIPLWFVPFHHQVQAEKFQVAQVQKEAQQYTQQWTSRRNQLLATLSQYEQAIRYLEESGLPAAREMQQVAQKSYFAGEISYLNYIQILESATNSQLDYLDNLNYYNQTYWELYYLTSLP